MLTVFGLILVLIVEGTAAASPTAFLSSTLTLQRKRTLRVRRNANQLKQQSWSRLTVSSSQNSNTEQQENQERPWAWLTNVDESDDLQQDLRKVLQRAGFRVFDNQHPASSQTSYFAYQLSRATGMLKLVSPPSSSSFETWENLRFEAPRWIPIVSNEENVLVANGWSFLDPDENDPISAFDVDAANLEGLYIPKWGQASNDNDYDDDETSHFSSLGFSVKPLSSEQIQQLAKDIHPSSRSVLLEGKTDPPQLKTTHNQANFTGATGQSDIEKGIFLCALGGLPLFTTLHLSPTTASSGWLSFTRPIADDHVRLVPPSDASSPDQRIEVVCARTKCHLGHYFGKGNGYCINASALNFIPRNNQKHAPSDRFVLPPIVGPESWRQLESEVEQSQSPSLQLLNEILEHHISTETVVLGAGCFWHVEFALRRLPGVIATQVGYAGGTTTSPTNADVCEKDTGHAEVVHVTFDPRVLHPRVLMDCFLSLHDPTKVRAHGKHAAGTGQYRSCVFVTTPELEHIAHDAMEDCKLQLDKELVTQVQLMPADVSRWFWRSEDDHQRHDERRRDLIPSNLSTLSAKEWLLQYGTRSASVLGSSESMVTTTSASTRT